MAARTVTASERNAGRIVAAVAVLWLALIVVGYGLS